MIRTLFVSIGVPAAPPDGRGTLRHWVPSPVIAVAEVLAIVLLFTGCTSMYWKDRGKDLVDPFGFGFGSGGLGFNVRATHFVQVGFGGELDFERRFRFLGRDVDWPGYTAFEAGVAPLGYIRAYEDGGVDATSRGVLFGRTFGRTGDDGSRELSVFAPARSDYFAGYDRRLFDIGVSVRVLIGGDVEFNPFELVDFVLGFFGADIADDDGSADHGADAQQRRRTPDVPADAQPTVPHHDNTPGNDSPNVLEGQPIDQPR